MKYRFVRDQWGRYPVRRMCRILDGSPSAYYAWLRRPESRRVREDRRLLVEIKAIHQAKRGTHGSPRINAELKAQGQNHSLKRVARLMRENGIHTKQKRKFEAATNSKHPHPVAPDLLERDFEASAPNQKLVANITYIPTREGWRTWRRS